MKTIINLTDHPFHELVTDTWIQPSGTVLRADNKAKRVKKINGMPIFTNIVSLIEELPPELPDTVYLVSALTMKAIPPSRGDFIYPGSVKRENGVVVGCYGFMDRI